MAYHYSDESREKTFTSLPDVEVFYQSEENNTADYFASNGVGIDPSPIPVGWNYAFGFPGCLWDSDPVGPFDSEAEALAAAREE